MLIVFVKFRTLDKVRKFKYNIIYKEINLTTQNIFFNKIKYQ